MWFVILDLRVPRASLGYFLFLAKTVSTTCAFPAPSIAALPAPPYIIMFSIGLVGWFVSVFLPEPCSFLPVLDADGNLSPEDRRALFQEYEKHQMLTPYHSMSFTKTHTERIHNVNKQGLHSKVINPKPHEQLVSADSFYSNYELARTES